MEKIIQCNCWDCRNETNHKVLFAYNQKVDNLDDSKKVTSTEYEDYSIVSCQGCNNVSFLLVKKSKGKNGLMEIEKEMFPYDSAFLIDDEDELLSFEEITALPLIVKNVYEEIAEIITFDVPILTGIGLRTLLEAICIHQGIKGKNLMEKINNLHKEGFIAAKDLPILHNLREIGNITVHQIKKPSEKTLHFSLEILKHTLRSLYIIPKFHSKIVRKKTV